MAGRPGLTGEGARQSLTVTGIASASTAWSDPLFDAAAATYVGYERAQSDDLLKSRVGSGHEITGHPPELTYTL